MRTDVLRASSSGEETSASAWKVKEAFNFVSLVHGGFSQLSSTKNVVLPFIYLQKNSPFFQSVVQDLDSTRGRAKGIKGGHAFYFNTKVNCNIFSK